MKKHSFYLILVLAISAQAVEWSNVKARNLERPTTKGLRNSRIVGGTLATRHQFPYQVGIYLDGVGFCGGSLISDSAVLTAAHCADGTREFEIHLAAQSINNVNEPDRQIVTSRSKIVHVAWNSDTANNDIALVQLISPVSGTGIEPVRLPSRSQQDQNFDGQTARISGWGHVADVSLSLSPELLFVDLSVIPNSICELFYGHIINNAKICTDSMGGTATTCNGDSGGPLVITETDSKPTQIGVVSFGSSAGCESGAPAVFTRLTSYLDWLEFNSGVAIRP